MRRWVSGCLGLLLAGFLTGTVGAQEDIEEACTYRACALRIQEGGWFSGGQVVRGSDGVVVADLSPSADLESLFVTSDSAAGHYELFVEKHERAGRMRWIGGALMVAGLVVGLIDRPWDQMGWAVLPYAGGVGVMIASSGPRRDSETELATAIWWYNRELTRESP